MMWRKSKDPAKTAQQAVSMPMASAFTRFVKIAYSSHSISDRKSSSPGKKNSGAILDWNTRPLKMLLIVYFLGWKILNLPNIDLHPFRATIPGTATAFTASMPGVLQVPKRPRAGTSPWRWCQVTIQRP